MASSSATGLTEFPEAVLQVINGIAYIRHPIFESHVDNYAEKAQSKSRSLFEWCPPAGSFLIAAALKSGTHWLWEIMMMLHRQSTEPMPYHKEYTFLEMAPTEDMPSDCTIYNTHILPSLLPPKVKKLKTVFILRNIKDVLVSKYYHLKSLPEIFNETLVPSRDDLTFESVFNKSILAEGGERDCGWFAYTKESWDRRNDPNCLLLFYEDLIENFKDNVKRLAKFMEVPLSDEFLEDIHKSTGLNNIRAAKKEKCSADDEVFLTLFRKGGIGGWKNYYTVAQNEILDNVYKGVMKGYEDIPFKYTQSSSLKDN